MTRRPDDFEPTMNGLWSSMMLTSVQYTMDGVYSALNQIDWWPFGAVKDFLFNVIDKLLLWITEAIVPGAPGAVNWFVAGPEAIWQVADATAGSLGVMQYQRRYLQNSLIPYYYQQAVTYAWGLYDSAIANEYQLYAQLSNDIYQTANAIYSYVSSQVIYIYNLINADVQAIYGYIAYVQRYLYELTYSLYNYLNSYIQAVRTELSDYINSVRDDLLSELNAAKLELSLAIAALGVYITTVEIPGALIIYTEEQTALLAVATDILWPVLAETTDATAVQIATTLPTVAVRAADVPPELLPWLPGLGEGVVAALTFHAGLHQSATVPLWNGLGQFAQDTSELSGIIGTVLLGALTVAAVADPVDTAEAVNTLVAEPLGAAFAAIQSIIGLT